MWRCPAPRRARARPERRCASHRTTGPRARTMFPRPGGRGDKGPVPARSRHSREKRTGRTERRNRLRGPAAVGPTRRPRRRRTRRRRRRPAAGRLRPTGPHLLRALRSGRTPRHHPPWGPANRRPDHADRRKRPPPATAPRSPLPARPTRPPFRPPPYDASCARGRRKMRERADVRGERHEAQRASRATAKRPISPAPARRTTIRPAARSAEYRLAAQAGWNVDEAPRPGGLTLA